MTRYEIIKELSKYIPNKLYLDYLLRWSDENLEKLLKTYQKQSI